MEETSVRIFLGREGGQSRKGYLQVDEMHREVIGRLRRIAQGGTISTRAVVDLLGMLERISKAFVDISDLSLPTFQFREGSEHSNRPRAAF
jgi:predicted DNA-binding protein with PD1-like motif